MSMRLLATLLLSLVLLACEETAGPETATPDAGPAVPVAPAAESTVRPADFTIADSAELVQPIAEGQRVPDVAVKNMEGQQVQLSALYGEQPIALVVYRGGWCPYCTTQLSALGVVKDQLNELGYQIVAVSPDTPEKLKETASEKSLDYRLVSDADAELIRAFGLAFRVDQSTVERYTGYGIKLVEPDSQSGHLLPVPAVYLINTQGQVEFAYWNADYKTRLEADKLLAAAGAE